MRGHTEEGIQRADPRFRRQVLTALLLFLLAGALAYPRLRAYLDETTALAAYDPDGAAMRVRRVLIVFAAVNAVVSIGLAAYMCSLGVRTHRAQRFPPPGVRVIRDTPVRTGRRARVMAAGQFVLAGGLLASNLISFGLWKMLEVLSAP